MLPLLPLFILVLLIFPGYRAPRLWPHISRTRDYARLSIVLGALLILFWIDVYAWAPWSSFYGILILPNLAFVSAYLLLHRTGAERRYRIAVSVWIVLHAFFAAHVIAADIDQTHRFAIDYSIPLKAVLVLATVAVAMLALDLPLRHERGRLAADK